MTYALPADSSHSQHKRYRLTILASSVALALVAASTVTADDQTSQPVKLPAIEMIGDSERLKNIPGSGAIIEEQVLKETQPLSTQDALRRIPGINVVETDGSGFYPRIGVRGLNPDMSKKVLILEDGAPIQLGPFTDPAAYYSPPIERMERIEILKGASSLRYGPSTVGGSINYITRNPEGGRLVLKGGSFGTGSILAEYGTVGETALGSISLLHKRSDGFRDMKYEITDVVIKAGMALSDNQFASLKFTHYDQVSSHTYLGLTEAEYRRDPDLNRAKNDRMYLKRSSLDLNHEWDISEDMTLKTLAYWSNPSRNWWREDFKFCGDENGCTDGYGNRVQYGDNYMRNSVGGRLREWTVYGIESRLIASYDAFGIRNEAEVGVRAHFETMNNQRINNPNSATARSGIIRDEDKRKADAYALFAQNRFIINDRFSVTPGLRIENYRQKRTIYRWRNNDVNVSSSDSNTEIVPGIGAVFALNPDIEVFAGVHRGFAPPRVQDAIDSKGESINLKAERSTNYEIGVRGQIDRTRFEATAFRYDFSNQLVQASEAGGATSGQLTNAGETLNQGLELGIGQTFENGFYAEANYTWVPTAKLDSTRIINGVDRKGNRLPYAPKHLANLRVGYDTGRWQTNIQGLHVSKQYSDFENTEAGSPDGRRGALPSYTVWNLNASYDLTQNVTVFGTVRNLFDKTYISSRAPRGIFPGMSRYFEAGVEARF